MSLTLEQRIARIEATEAIRRLIGLYALAGDRKNDRAMFTELFAEDATWSAEGFGAFEGKAAILDGLCGISSNQVLWSLHFPVSPIITLADDLKSAKAFWWLWELGTLRDQEGDKSSFMGGTYDADLVERGGTWLFKSVVLKFQTITPFRDGWTLL
jgi:hypothetical protein